MVKIGKLLLIIILVIISGFVLYASLAYLAHFGISELNYYFYGYVLLSGGLLILLIQGIRGKISWRKIGKVIMILGFTYLAQALIEEKNLTYVYLNDGISRTKVPAEISRTKDCQKYEEWFAGNFTPMIKWDYTCPWAKKPKGPIGEFEIGGLKFYIPRNYILFTKNMPDGPSDGLFLEVLYPDMGPVIGDAYDQQLTITINIEKNESFKESSYFNMKSCNQTQYIFQDRVRINDKTDEDLRKAIKKTTYRSDLNVMQYDIESIYRDVYIRGELRKPQYWLICNFHCKSVIELNNDVYIEYTFNEMRLIKQHDEIRKKVEEKVREFLKEPEKLN